jgi:hypothetical protein
MKLGDFIDLAVLPCDYGGDGILPRSFSDTITEWIVLS